MKPEIRIFALSAALLVAASVASGCSGKSDTALPPRPVVSSVPPYVKSYTTDFPLAENPISEGGRWMDGGSVGLDWGNVWTKPGVARGHAGRQPFADSVALLTGDWGPEQTAEAVVEKRITWRAPEVSLRLRSSLSPHWCSGYEVSEAVRSDDSAYLIIVRWNGRLADFTYLLHVEGRQYGVKTGDVMKATISGDVISAYKNGVLIGQAKDDKWKAGEPGFGFNEGNNGEYGITRFTATAADAAP